MPTVTIDRGDVTDDQVADALRRGLGPRYQVVAEAGDGGPQGTSGWGRGQAVVVGARPIPVMFKARVEVSSRPNETVLHIRPAGLSLLRIVNLLWVSRKVSDALQETDLVAASSGTATRTPARPSTQPPSTQPPSTQAPSTQPPSTQPPSTPRAVPAAPAARSTVPRAPVAASPGARDAALSVDHLTKRFGSRVAFDDVSFEVSRGEVFGFLGPNGAGKTTTVRTLGTLLEPSSGSATVAGIPLRPENGVEIRQRISLMPEAPGLYLRLSVAENLTCFAGLYELADPGDRIDRALQAVHLTDRRDDPCGALSKGLRQRVSLARALLNEPEILFLDEPTSGLDPAAARDVHELIDDLRLRGVTIFLTTHRLEEAERLCDRVAILNTSLRVIGSPDELRDQLFERTITIVTLEPLEDPGSVFTGLPAVDGWHEDGSTTYVLAVTDPAHATPAAVRALVAAGADVISVGESRHSLEDVYLELVNEDAEAGRR